MEIPRKILSAWAVCAILSACASGMVSRSDPSPRKSRRTVVLFLVDGLSAHLLKSGLEKNLLPNTRQFFLRDFRGFRLARASFPTLTYPNIASILTGRRIGEQPVISNHVVENGEVVNYEDHGQHDLLRERIDPRSIFGEIEKTGGRSASFSYVFGLNATDHLQFGLREGLEYQTHRYKDLDGRLIGDLELYLSHRSASEWPEFIYVHLVGVDGTSHQFGSKSRKAENYLAWLDGRLRRTFQLLAAAEGQGRNVVTALTADHGFVETKNFSDVAGLVSRAEPNVLVTNESRFLGLYFKHGARVRPLLRRLRSALGVEFTVLRNGPTIELESRSNMLRFAYGPALCKTEPFTLALLQSGHILAARSTFECAAFFQHPAPYPFLVEDLAAYLSVPHHPDAVVIAKPGFTFSNEFKANHGGPTAEEIFVPLLLRNARLPEGELLRTSDLLRRLGG